MWEWPPVAEPTPQAAFGGCLARVFNLFGFFLLVTGGFAAVRSFNSGADDFGFVGALVPGLALLLMSRAIRRRVGQGPWAGDNPARDQPSAKLPPQHTSPQVNPKAPKAPPPRPAPVEISEVFVEEGPDQGIEAIEDLSLEDFKPEKPLSSEERIRRARQKYNKRSD